MAGYANRVITLHFPELSEEGDDVHVVMRNPKTLSENELKVEQREDMTAEQKEEAIQARIASLIIGWHVYDTQDTGDDQRRLPLPATAELVGKHLPHPIINKIAESFAEAMGMPIPQPAAS